ncbi:chaoptin-like [Manduca sexta]|uniref:chaoptin-like n=1 Tax=Manduca sexta TaxID=7130 RepID=UPI00188E1666|nr:chaoptin-like [Manduca sexta]
MIRLLVVFGPLVLWSFLASGEMLDFDDRNTSDLCYLCACSLDKTYVDCSRRGLTDIPEGLGSEVKKLNISYNEISIFPPSINRFYNLNALDIRGNRLTELPANALQNLTTLEVLNLSKNYFETWLNLNPNEVFEPATHLKTLDLSHNKFKTMGNLANQELLISSSLEILILDHCQIDSIHGRSPLSGLINIRILSLNHNPLQRIHSLISPTLNSLFVNNCELSNINRNELTYLPSLVYLQMSHNYRLELSSSTYNLYSESLKFLDISYCNVLQPNLQGFPNLRKAVLNHNMVRFLGSNEFANNTKLEYLDLSYNNIGSLRSDTFRGLSKLKYLDLSWNEIAVMPEDSLLQMPSLTNLKLARNYLTRVGHLKSMSITVLDISSCEISAIGKDSLEGLQSLVDLDLSRNLLSYIPESISSNTLRYLNLNYNRISTVNNFTFFMLPRLTGLAVIGNRFTTIWKRSFFDSNVYLERLDLGDNMWRCDCADDGMFDFYDFITLEPNKKEESYNLICNSPANVIGQTWLEACYFIWNPSEKNPNIDSLIWFIIVMIITLSLCILLVNTIRRSMKRRLRNIQAERERQVEEARDRLRQLRIRAEQEALCNTPDPRDLIAPPSYDEALSMPKLNTSCHSLNETGTGKTRRKRGRRKTKSSGDLLEETERNGNVRTFDDMELAEPSGVDRQRRPRRNRRYGSHEIAELDTSPGARRRQIISEYVNDNVDSIVVEVEAELERPSRRTERSISTDDNLRHESDF